MPRIKEKRERALGMKLFIKGARCNSPKCAVVRRPSRPGMHGKKRGRRSLSEFGQQLLEKQRLRVSYGLRERQLARIVLEAMKRPGAGEEIIKSLERQLGNVVFRIGLAPSRSAARQMVVHGHVLVNGRKLSMPSYVTNAKDIISVKPSSKELLIFKEAKDRMKNTDIPDWLSVDAEKIEGEIKALPGTVETPFDINLIVDYYSK